MNIKELSDIEEAAWRAWAEASSDDLTLRTRYLIAFGDWMEALNDLPATAINSPTGLPQ